MNTNVRRRVLAYILFGALVVPAEIGIVGEVVGARPSCVQAMEWARAHATALPTGAEFLALPVAYRRAVHGMLPPNERLQIWQTHLARVLKTQPLTDIQVQLVKEAQAKLSAAVFERPRSAEADAWFNSFRERAKQHFRTREEVAIFTVPGGPSTSIVSVRTGFAAAREWLRNKATVDAVSNETCECSRGDDWCFWFPGMVCMPENCGPVGDGCGTFFTEPCDGMCGYTPL